MINKSDMEIAYENYLQSDDIEVEIDGVKFYKIITKEKVPVRDGIVTICVSRKMFIGNENNTILDENGKKFSISSPAFYSFRGEIPRWYLDTFTVVVNDISEENDIGSYITLS